MLKQQLNDEKWHEGYLVAFGWAVLLCCVWLSCFIVLRLVELFYCVAFGWAVLLCFIIINSVRLTSCVFGSCFRALAVIFFFFFFFKDERGPSSVWRTLKLFQNQRWGNFWKMGWIQDSKLLYYLISFFFYFFFFFVSLRKNSATPLALTGSTVAETGSPVAKTGSLVVQTGNPIAQTGSPIAQTGSPVA